MESNDHISKLPKDVAGKILSCLPIQDAVCTSILSRRWRYQWSNLSQIAIDEQLYCTRRGSEYEKKFVNFVDYMFLLHNGPISKFKIKVSFEIHSFIDRWILLLTRKGIKELILHLTFSSNIYRLPSCLFHHSVIACLDMRNCSFILPATFSGFNHLTKLVLRNVAFVNNGLQFLLSVSPNLKVLDIAYISGLSLLTISGLELTDLRIEGGFETIGFKDIPHLADAYFDVVMSLESSNMQLKSGSKLVEVFGQMYNIQKLRLCRDALKYLALGDVPVRLPTALALNQLFMDINFEDKQDLLVTFCILRSCPAIRKLGLMVKSNKTAAKIPSAGITFGNEMLTCTLDQLEYMNLIGFSGINSELMFAEFILANATVLKRMNIEFKENVKGLCKIFIELIRCPRISPKAELIIHELNIPY